MGTEAIILHHSTTQASFSQAEATGRIFGIHALKETSSGTLSNLTPDKVASQQFARAHQGTRWMTKDGPPTLVTLAFSVPTDLVVQVGETKHYHCPEYATILDVAAADLPDEYLASIHAGERPMTREQAIRLEEEGMVRFYQLPMTYLVASEIITP